MIQSNPSGTRWYTIPRRSNRKQTEKSDTCRSNTTESRWEKLVYNMVVCARMYSKYALLKRKKKKRQEVNYYLTNIEKTKQIKKKKKEKKFCFGKAKPNAPSQDKADYRIRCRKLTENKTGSDPSWHSDPQCQGAKKKTWNVDTVLKYWSVAAPRHKVFSTHSFSFWFFSSSCGDSESFSAFRRDAGCLLLCL